MNIQWLDKWYRNDMHTIRMLHLDLQNLETNLLYHKPFKYRNLKSVRGTAVKFTNKLGRYFVAKLLIFCSMVKI